LEKKLKIIRDVENKVEYNVILETYGLKTKSNISDIIKAKDKWLALATIVNKAKTKSLKRNRGSNYPEVDNALALWVRAKRQQKAPINGPLLRKKANEFAERLNVTNFDANNGFITRFVKRHDLKYESKSGESESVNEDIVIEWKNSLKEKYNSYEHKNIFNIDETGIFWRLLQNKTYSLPEESAKGYKKIKDRITVLLLVNMDGSERLIVVIGKYKNPRCFKGIKNLPIWLYLHNRTAWMTSETFNEIMLKLDKRMRKQNRSILVLLDNCASHPFLNLNNIKLLFLPPNTTSRLQPLDAGIIRSFKQRYRNRIS
jgi:hypothetical protein